MKDHRYEMGIIGNCSYIAHIDKYADVKWLCWPRFDSSFIFGGLLDDNKGGHFYIKPRAEKYTTGQYYLTNTNILCTEFECSKGKFRVIDFAPRFFQYERFFKPLMLFRKIEPLEGNPEVIVSCKPVGEYGNIIPEDVTGSNHIRFLGLKKQVRLSANIPLNFIQAERAFFLNKTKHLALAWGIPLEAPLESTCEEFLHKTQRYWQVWVNDSTICNFHQKEVIRSSLVLKLHQYEDTGAIIAASTTSLPESPNDGRTWDYRFCWLRDAYFTLQAFNNLGHFDGLRHYANFVRNIAIDEQDRYSPVYSITVNRQKLHETELDLKGYLGNKPVRIGNQAHEHVQNDIYGEIMISLLPLLIDERFSDKDEYTALNLPGFLLKMIEETFEEPDAGLWEFRNYKQQNCYTYLFHWAGAHSALKIARKFKYNDLEKRAQKIIKRAGKAIDQCYDPIEKVYRQAIGTDRLDASLFQLINMNYLDPATQKARNHLTGLEKGLKTNNSLFFRYKHKDDFGKPRNAFLVCSFWYVEALASTGQIDKAIEAFDDLMHYSNHLGLLSEDIDPENGGQWGNFPQTYSHVGLVNAAFRIANKLDRPVFL